MTERQPEPREGDPESDFSIPADADLDLPSDPADSGSEKAAIDPDVRKDR
jgi:hypothetical protein